MSDVSFQLSEVSFQMSDVRCQLSEVRGQRTGVSCQSLVVRGGFEASWIGSVRRGDTALVSGRWRGAVQIAIAMTTIARRIRAMSKTRARGVA